MTAALELLTRSPSSAQQLQLLSLVAAMARSSEAAGAELAQAGAPAVLLQMVAVEPMPRTQVGRGGGRTPSRQCARRVKQSYTKHTCGCAPAGPGLTWVI